MSEMFRMFTVMVDAKTGTVTPNEWQAAGVRGDHRALRLVFEPLDRQYLYQLEIVDGSGAYDVTEPFDAIGGRLEYDVPASWTAPGIAAIRLVAVGTEPDSLVRHFSPIYLHFADREDGDPMGEMIPRWQTVMTEAESAAQDASAAADEARDAAFRVGAAQTLKGVYIGSGDLPDDYAVQIDPNGDPFTMDETVDATSENPVKNRAVAKEINDVNARCADNEIAIVNLQQQTSNKFSSGNLLEVALTLPAGIHAVQNLHDSTPFQYCMSIVCKNAADRCTVYCYGHNGLYMNNYTADEGGVGTWDGWRYCAATAVDL